LSIMVWMSGFFAPVSSYEELAVLVARLSGELVETRAELERANIRIAELEAWLGRSPGNSSLPLSSQGLDKPAPKSLRKNGQRRPGRVKGHPGEALKMVGKPDKQERHEPVACRGCGSGLAGAREVGVERR
jgi:transposase